MLLTFRPVVGYRPQVEHWTMDIHPTRLKTVGDSALSVAASIFWNELPGHATAAESLTTFPWRLKTFLFHRYFPEFS